MLGLKTEIYKLLCEGYAQCKIAEILHINKAYISRITQKLIAENYVFCINPHSNPKLYKPTDKPLPLNKGSVDNLRGGCRSSPTGLCRVHCISRSYLLSRPPKLPIIWDKEWVNNGTTYSQLRWVEPVGLVTVRLIRGNGDNGRFGRLVIWMPEKYMSYEQLEIERKVLDSYCQHVANKFMKMYHCQLGLPEFYQKPHFAFPEDPDFVHVVKKMNLSSERVWVDDSHSGGEWETSDVRLARVKMELPERVLSLEVKVGGIEDAVNRIAGSVDRLLGLFEVPGRVDECRDVV